MFLGPVTEVEVAWQKKADTLERCFLATMGEPGKVEIHGQITWNPGFYRAADENTEALPPQNSHSIWKMLVGRLFVPFGKSYFEGRTVSFGQIISWGGVSLDYAILSFRIKTISQEYYQA